jgi:hypothetical protein
MPKPGSGYSSVTCDPLVADRQPSGGTRWPREPPTRGHFFDVEQVNQPIPRLTANVRGVAAAVARMKFKVSYQDG